MTDAYQCDRCGEFDTAEPKRYVLREYHNTTGAGWTNPERLHTLHLCGDCAESLESTVGEWLDGPQERGRDDD